MHWGHRHKPTQLSFLILQGRGQGERRGSPSRPTPKGIAQHPRGTAPLPSPPSIPPLPRSWDTSPLARPHYLGATPRLPKHGLPVTHRYNPRPRANGDLTQARSPRSHPPRSSPTTTTTSTTTRHRITWAQVDVLKVMAGQQVLHRRPCARQQVLEHFVSINVGRCWSAGGYRCGGTTRVTRCGCTGLQHQFDVMQGQTAMQSHRQAPV